MRPQILFSCLILFLVIGCSDKDNGPYVCESCPISSEALAANDNSGKGIYKGIVLGSSGTIKFNIANNDDAITGVLVFDGETYELKPWPDPAVFDKGFSGILAGSRFVENDLLIEFTVNASGSSHTVNVVTIPGHSGVTIKTLKEFSTGLIEIFEGTFSGQANGTFNLIVKRNKDGNGEWFAISRDTDGFVQFIDGSIQNGVMSGQGSEVEVMGTLEGDNMSGSWTNFVEDISGSWTGRRTL